MGDQNRRYIFLNIAQNLEHKNVYQKSYEFCIYGRRPLKALEVIKKDFFTKIKKKQFRTIALNQYIKLGKTVVHHLIISNFDGVKITPYGILATQNLSKLIIEIEHMVSVQRFCSI